MKRYFIRLLMKILEDLIPVLIDLVQDKIKSGDLDEAIDKITVRVIEKQTA